MIAHLNNIHLNYWDEKGKAFPPVFSNLNLSIKKGDFFFITGASGAGKTSLLKLIYLDLQPTNGKVMLFNKNINSFNKEQRYKTRKQIGVIFQEHYLINHMTVFENVALPLLIDGKKITQFEKDIKMILDWVDLGHHIHSLPLTLSGGEKQRVALARAVISKPDLIVADEPTGNVDQKIGSKIMDLLISLNKFGSTILIATHDQQIIKTYQKPTLELKNKNIYLLNNT